MTSHVRRLNSSRSQWAHWMRILRNVQMTHNTELQVAGKYYMQWLFHVYSYSLQWIVARNMQWLCTERDVYWYIPGRASHEHDPWSVLRVQPFLQTGFAVSTPRHVHPSELIFPWGHSRLWVSRHMHPSVISLPWGHVGSSVVMQTALEGKRVLPEEHLGLFSKLQVHALLLNWNPRGQVGSNFLTQIHKPCCCWALVYPAGHTEFPFKLQEQELLSRMPGDRQNGARQFCVKKW